MIFIWEGGGLFVIFQTCWVLILLVISLSLSHLDPKIIGHKVCCNNRGNSYTLIKNNSLATTQFLSFFHSYLPLTFLKYRYITLWNTSGKYFAPKQDTAWYKIVPSKVIRLTKTPLWKIKMATLWCDVSCQHNLNQYVNILTGKYFNFNFKCMEKTLNKPNKWISVQLILFNNQYLLNK